MRRRRKGCKAWTQLKLQVVRSDPEFVTTTAGPAFNFSRPNVDEAQVARITSFALEALSKSINAPGAISAVWCQGRQSERTLVVKIQHRVPKVDDDRIGVLKRRFEVGGAGNYFFWKIQDNTSSVKTVRWRHAC